MNQVVFKDLGLKDYKEAWDYQNELFQGIIDIKLGNRKSELKQISPNYFLFTEHPPVYTLGKSGDLSNLLLNEEQLKQKGISFFKSEIGIEIFSFPILVFIITDLFSKSLGPISILIGIPASSCSAYLYPGE